MSGMDEQDLVRALSAPPTAAELADEAAYREMFRSVGPVPGAVRLSVVRPRAGRIAIRRVGTTSTLAAVFAIAGAGVAAAYAAHLPAPVQSAVHRVLAPIGVPPAEPQRVVARPDDQPAAPSSPEAPAPQPGAEPTSAPAPSGSPSASPSARPSASPSESPSDEASPTDEPTPTEIASPGASPSASPTASPTAPVPLPTTTPSPSEPTPTAPTASATPSVPPPVPAAVSLAAGVGNRVAPGQTTVFSGAVTDASGAAVPGVRVLLQERETQGWQAVGETTTTADGRVSLSSPPADRTARYRLKVGDVRSSVWRLALQPTLSASARTTGVVSTATARVAGGQTGDSVLLLARRDGRLVTVANGRLDSSGGVRFDVPAPATQAKYVVRLLPTRAHAGVRTKIVVPGAAQATASPSASPSATPSVTPSP